jgi:hypothetical protein
LHRAFVQDDNLGRHRQTAVSREFLGIAANSLKKSRDNSLDPTLNKQELLHLAIRGAMVGSGCGPSRAKPSRVGLHQRFGERLV